MRQRSSGVQYSEVPIEQNTYLMFGGTIHKATGTLYSKAMLYFYNGNGYSAYSSNASPNINVTSISNDTESIDLIKSYKINIYGETYGSDFYADILGYEPDLIAVENKDGVEGYVKNEEMNVTFTNPSDAAEWSQAHREPYAIPMYDENGRNIIGEFEIMPGEVIYSE